MIGRRFIRLNQQLMNRVPSVDSKEVQGIMSPRDDCMGRLSSNRHTHDHSGETQEDNLSASLVDGNAPKTFPEVLKSILSDAKNKSAIAWLPHGKAFLVLDRKKFVEEVLPRYLGKATKYTSFTRKLSRWNFARVASGPDEEHGSIRASFVTTKWRRFER